MEVERYEISLVSLPVGTLCLRSIHRFDLYLKTWKVLTISLFSHLKLCLFAS